MNSRPVGLLLACLLGAVPADAASPVPRSPGDVIDRNGESRRWHVASRDLVLRDFRFHDGSVLPELRIHYRTLGRPHRDANGAIDNAVLLLHGTGQNGTEFLAPQFADPLYGPGAALDENRFFVVMPDDIGHGNSSRPSDGARMRFPHYDYADMVAAEHALVRDALGIERLRLILGTSMGCMHAYLWGTTYPGQARALMAMSCTPFPIAGRNWFFRQAVIDAIERDPAWAGGAYVREPANGLRDAEDIIRIALSGAPAMQAAYPTRDAATALAHREVPAAADQIDADDTLYQFEASADYDASADLDRIGVPVLWWDSGDDFINPPELDFAARVVAAHPNIRYRLLPAASDTRGHLTYEYARFFAADLSDLLERTAAHE